MKYSRAIISIFLFFFFTEAQNTSTIPHSSPILQPSIAIIIGVLGLLFFVLLSIFIYTIYCYRNNPDLLSPHHNLRHLLLTRSKFSGIDRSVIDSIPFFKFSLLKGSKEGLECAICLSIFEDSEILRLLPKCKHAFHMNCIDEWLESHSSCPICRYKFGSDDFTSPIYEGSLRYDGNTSAHHLMDIPNIEFFVEREEQRDRSTRFNFGNNLRKVSKWRGEDCLAIIGDVGKKFHKYKHKIVVKDIFFRRRWSDLNSSDLTLLNSEMLHVMSSKRIDSKYDLSLDEKLTKIKENMEKKRTFESKKGKLNHTRSDTISPRFGNDKVLGSKLLTSADKRSMSEITILTRFKDLCAQNNTIADSSSLLTDSRDERIRSIWVPIVRRTLQWFAVGESNFDKSDMNMNLHMSNV